ncbi:TPA: hypothetical protein N0F65_002405, partial [Lagenidium giganteum]
CWKLRASLAPPPSMNAAQYIISRMRSCKSPPEGDVGDRSGQLENCFASVGSATHDYHGDDAVGYGPGFMVVADGVSGTMKSSGVLAKLLVAETLASLAKLKKRALDTPIKASDFSESVEQATRNARKATKRKGRLDSTLSAVYFDDASRQLFAYTIGDCKCVLVRSGKVVFESDSIIYDFNVPAVVSSNQTINYSSEVQIQTCAYEPGDVCLLFSDGVHDNLYVDQVIECVELFSDNADEIAKKTVQMAKDSFTECEDYIPFAVSAASFCREAVEELKSNSNVNEEEYKKFSAKCADIPSAEITRPIFNKEQRVRQLAFYSASNLLAFAHKKMGKKDDVSRFRQNQRRPFSKKSRNGADDGTNGKDSRDNKKDQENFSEWVYTNESFIKYYQAQGIVDPSEWETLMTYLAKPLPTTFRINNSCAFAERIRERMAQDFQFDGLVVDDEPVEPISNMAWYPNNRGYQWSVERRRIRKLPLLAEFQKWLVELSDSGNITRQEAVSMIPPLVLDVQPHHKVLDMCAAPGSKTSQLLESLHAQEHVTGKVPTGMVVANDVDLKRAYMLVHQSKRMSSPALVVTCHEAQHIPHFGNEDDQTNGFFDRILCDAPCSGDGTLRKNPIIWKQWHVRNGITLHPLQLQIAKRGAALLKVGGEMCYSTCTFNPLENEAVVAELLRWSKGALELVDVSQALPVLKRRPGMSSWKVMDLSLEEVNSYHEAVAKKDERTPKLLSTMFPPTAEEAARFNLDRCMRCVPQDANTGGFFICLFKKVAPTPVEEPVKTRAERRSERAEAKKDATPAADGAENAAEGEESTEATDAPAAEADGAAARPIEEDKSENKPQRKSRRDRFLPKGEEPYIALAESQWEELKQCYDMADDFPRHQLLTRSEESKSLTFVTQSITAELLAEMREKRVKVVYAGLKIFERNLTSDGKKVYRMCHCGVHICLPYVRTRVFQITAKDLQTLVESQGELLSFNDFEPETQKNFEAAALGSVLCTLNREPGSMVEKMLMNVAVWRGKSSVSLMAAKPDAQALLAAMKELKLWDETVSAHVAKCRAERRERAKPQHSHPVAAVEQKQETEVAATDAKPMDSAE